MSCFKSPNPCCIYLVKHVTCCTLSYAVHWLSVRLLCIRCSVSQFHIVCQTTIRQIKNEVEKFKYVARSLCPKTDYFWVSTFANYLLNLIPDVKNNV